MKPWTCSVKNLNKAFVECAYKILRDGESVSPRGEDTLEIRYPVIQIMDPSSGPITMERRKHPYSFNSAELIWILSGSDDLWIADYLPKWRDFADQNPSTGREFLAGAYGMRLRHVHGVDQFKYVIDELRRDTVSRRAMAIIADPELDTKNYKDKPCTQLFQFSIRNNKLDLGVFMRSNDLLLGFSSDVFNFCAIQCLFASILKVPPGSYYHTAGSLHIYKLDIPKIQYILDYPNALIDPQMPSLTSMDYDSLGQVYEDASYGKNLKRTRELPSNDRYLTRLMRSMLDRSARLAAQNTQKNS